MIRSLEHTFAATAGTFGRLDRRQSFVWMAAICLGLEDMNYQPKTNGMLCSQQLI